MPLSESATMASVARNPNIFTVLELKDMLKRRNLMTTGKKSELIARLMFHDSAGEWTGVRDSAVSEGTGVVSESSSVAIESSHVQREMELAKREKKLMKRELKLARCEV